MENEKSVYEILQEQIERQDKIINKLIKTNVLTALILAIVVCPVPPFATPKVPVTPGVILAEPLNAAAAVLARLVCIFRPVCNVVAVEALPTRLAYNVPSILAEPLTIKLFKFAMPCVP